MPVSLSIPQTDHELRPRITVFGVGGAGGNAVNNMIRACLEGIEFVVANTDAQALKGSLADKRIQLGHSITRGLGAGSRPDVGRAAAEEALEEITGCLDGCNMAFITAGMGGGTGTGAAPVIARTARELGILTVGVVTKPFHFEGAHRMRLAEAGILELQQFVDTLIIIPNQNLFRIANEKTTFADAFKMADDVLHSGVRGVTDLMVMPGLINLDFADIRAVMSEMGKAMMGTGEATGERRAVDAAEAAISNPLLDDVSMKGAKGVLINITGGLDMTLFEVDEAANRIRDEVDPEANIIFGSTFDESLEGKMRVSVVATGIDAADQIRPMPLPQPPLAVVSGGRGMPRPPMTGTTMAGPAIGVAGVAPTHMSASHGASSQATMASAHPVYGARAEPSFAGALHTHSPAQPVTNAVTMSQTAPKLDMDEMPQPMADHHRADADRRPVFRAPAQPATSNDMFHWPSAPTAAAPAASPAASPAAGPAAAQIATPSSGPVAGSAATATHASAQQPVAGTQGESRSQAELRAPEPRPAEPQPRSGLMERLTTTIFGNGGTQAHPAPAAAPAPARPSTSVKVTTTPATQPMRADHRHTSPADDELLDIPAFLRRQAN